MNQIHKFNLLPISVDETKQASDHARTLDDIVQFVPRSYSSLCPSVTHHSHTVVQKPVGLTLGKLQIQGKFFNSLFMNLKIFDQKSCLYQ